MNWHWLLLLGVSFLLLDIWYRVFIQKFSQEFSVFCHLSLANELLLRVHMNGSCRGLVAVNWEKNTIFLKYPVFVSTQWQNRDWVIISDALTIIIIWLVVSYNFRLFKDFLFSINLKQVLQRSMEVKHLALLGNFYRQTYQPTDQLTEGSYKSDTPKNLFIRWISPSLNLNSPLFNHTFSIIHTWCITVIIYLYICTSQFPKINGKIRCT